MTTREWRFFAQDMLDRARKAVAYVDGLDQAAFVANDLIFDATLRNLERIGEAATHVPEHVRAGHPEVPWRKIDGLRKRLVHGYLGIDEDVLWSVLRHDLPPLVEALEVIASSWSGRRDGD